MRARWPPFDLTGRGGAQVVAPHLLCFSWWAHILIPEGVDRVSLWARDENGQPPGVPDTDR